MKAIHWIANHPTPYNDSLYSAIVETGRATFTAHYLADVLPSHPWSAETARAFESRVVKLTAGIDPGLIRAVLNGPDSIFVLAGWHEPIFLSVALVCSAIGRSFALVTDTPRIGASEPRDHLRRLVLRMLFRRASAVFGTGSPAVRALQSLGCPRERIIDLPYFIDVDRFATAHSARAPPAPHRIRIASVGRLVLPAKGHDVALEALAQVARRMPNLDFDYVLVGEGPDRQSIENRARVLGLGSRVRFNGWTEARDLPGVLQRTDVLLHPSRHEPYGVAILEAMASGVAVLASDACGAALDRIVHGANGMIHRVNDVDQLAEQILMLADAPACVVEMGQAAWRTAIQWPPARGAAIVCDALGV